uniref:Lymphotoxin-beta n=1 Tax=Piliocolobus tephrosceles TaxID=591936 RepID=A0A8C9LZJ7_9PRIM
TGSWVRGAGVCGKSQPGVQVYREGVAPSLRYESPLLWLWFSLNGGTGAGGQGWEAPGEGLPPASCGRSHFSGDPVAGGAYHCPGCAGLSAPGSERTGFQKLPEEEPEADLSPGLPAAHLIGAPLKGQGLGWEATKEQAFLTSGTQFSDAEGLALPQDGLYYLYCLVGYRGRAPPGGGEPRGRSVTLRSSLYRAGGAYGPGTPELLLEGAETVTPVLDPAGRQGYGPLWYTSVGFGGLVQLRRGERVYVNISHPDMVDFARGKTFFGAVMVG